MPLWPDDYPTPPGDARGDLDAFRAGEERILAALYRAWRPVLELQLRRGAGAPAVRDEALRADMLHEIFLRAFADGARDRYDGLRPFGAWIRVIARNVVINWHNASAQKQVFESLDAPDAPERLETSQAPEAEEVAEIEELRALVDRFLDGLEAEERLALELLIQRNAGQITQSEAAARMGTSHTRLRRIERRVLARFRRWLRGHGYLNPMVLSLLL